ncbi:hypothetical protein [Lacticaseibacillus suilingensis]|uniref:hypothetical protein n=1 Tax=Lacticaseibacillus suilingensis TaxID=2799577 RepID=UPI0022DFC33E|nr:hypothetical protein [Lacticaseibacillus suilingensis]
MEEERIVASFLGQGRRKCMDYLIETHQGSAQSINMECLAMTDMEIASWCKDVAIEIKEQLAMA